LTIDGAALTRAQSSERFGDAPPSFVKVYFNFVPYFIFGFS